MKKYLTPHIFLTISYDDEPYAVRIIPSGWSQPRQYHIIHEYGDMEQSEYAGLMTLEQIKEKFNIDIDLEESSLKFISRKQPNDQLLGRELREIINSQIKTI
jgi:hypothetical protein